MTSATRAERSALCDTMLEVGADAPTLCGDWTAQDLAAHLVVRERRPDAGPGIVTPFLADYSEHVRRTEAARPFADIVDRVRRGPPRWSPMRVDAVDRTVNSVEFFVHHEDLRRASRPFSVRSLDPALEDALADSISRAGRFLARGLPVGLVLEPSERLVDRRAHGTGPRHRGRTDRRVRAVRLRPPRRRPGHRAGPRLGHHHRPRCVPRDLV